MINKETNNCNCCVLDDVDSGFTLPEYLETAGQVRDILTSRYRDRVMLAHVHSYGCQQNVSDGERIMGLLEYIGYEFTNTPENADIVIYNTCAVRENAEDKVYGNIGELKRLKAERPDMIIGLCGCMTQQEHVTERILKSYPHIDLVFGTQALHKMPKMILDLLSGQTHIVELSMDNKLPPETMPAVREKNSVKANLPIMYGCDNFCTYCVVPLVRGREKSRKSADILREFKALADAGYKEITLLGQNVNSYGRGLDEDIDFPKLLRLLNNVHGDFRIRFMSSHPKDAGTELIDAIAECDKVCKHFHLPVQSGSDRILKLMNRHYTAEDYFKIVDYAREKIPDIIFTSDIIVGFPGETREDFEKTLELIKRVKFNSVFSFIYSKREGTKAAEMQDVVSEEEKGVWFRELLAVQKAAGRKQTDSFVGKTVSVLVDGESELSEGFVTGRDDAYNIVSFRGGATLIGKLVRVMVTKSLGWALEGEAEVQPPLENIVSR